jgi:organic hydroperoxide reductase OsmC/OhrA
MNASAASLGISMPSNTDDSVVDATVHLVGDLKKLDLGLRVDMKVRVAGLSKGDLQKVVDKAKEVCPYSRATQGNVETKIEIVGL